MSSDKYSQLQHEMEFLTPLRLQQRRIAADVSLADLAYLAGIVDGEGTIMASHVPPREGNPLGTYQLRLQVVSTTYELMTWCKEKFGGNITGDRRKVFRENQHKWKPAYAALWYAGFAKETIRLIEPYLIIKKAQALIALEFPTDKSRVPAVREELYRALRVLNKKGPKETVVL